MFTVDCNITDLKLREKNVIKVFFSMNVHQVAAPDMSLEEARSYVFFFNEGRETLSSYIGLHFLHTDRKLFYTYSNNPFPYAQLPEVEDESRNFAEDLGAMLDEIDFAKMSDLEKDRWIDEQEIFSGRKKNADTSEVNGTDPTACGEAEAGLKSGEAEQMAPAGQPMTVQPAAAGPAAESSAPARTSPPAAPEGEQKRSQPEAQAQQPAGAGTQVPPAAIEQVPPEQQPLKAKSRPQRKPAAPQAPPSRPDAPAARPERTDDVLAQAVRDGIVKAPREQLRKDICGSAGLMSRDKEALARLLSSF